MKKVLKKNNQPKIFEHLYSIIPKTYREAIIKYPWLKCQSYEWDNRTYLENIEYILIESSFLKVSKKLDLDFLMLEYDKTHEKKALVSSGVFSEKFVEWLIEHY